MSFSSKRFLIFDQKEPDLSLQTKSNGAFGIHVPECNTQVSQHSRGNGLVTEDKSMSAWLSLPVAPDYYPLVSNNNGGQTDMHVFSDTFSTFKSHVSKQGDENPPHQIFQYWDRLDSNSNGIILGKSQNIVGRLTDSAAHDRSGPRPTTPRYRLVQVERLLSFGDESAEAGIGMILDKDFTKDQLFIFHLQYGSPALATGLLAIGGASA
jgi:hypothetical protein